MRHVETRSSGGRPSERTALALGGGAAGAVEVSPSGAGQAGAAGRGEPVRQGRPLEGADRTLAPYFAVAGDANTERLPLKETSADVTIAGVIARVKVHQVFANDGARADRGDLRFPASTRAAVHGMRMTHRRARDRGEDRRSAGGPRRRYEAARQEGKRASLLEQERPNVFTMNVANMMPGDRIEVELRLLRAAGPRGRRSTSSSTRRWSGPRYGGGADPQADQLDANPYLHAGQPEPTGSTSHVARRDRHRAQGAGLAVARGDVQLRRAQPRRRGAAAPGGGNRDFVLRYRLAGDKIETGAAALAGARRQRESFFAVMMEPPRKPRRRSRSRRASTSSCSTCRGR